MSAKSDTGEQPVAADPAATPEGEAATPEYVSKADYDTLKAQLAHMNEGMNAIMQGLGQTRQQAPIPEAPKPAAPTYTDEQLAEMIDEGGVSAIRAMRFINDQAQAPLREDVQRKWQQTIAIGNGLSARVIKDEIPYASDPEIRREMDAYLATVPEDVRANPDALILAHNLVVGSPKHMKRFIAQGVQEELRRLNGGAAVTDPAAGSTPPGRVPAQPAGKSVEELFGSDVASALAAAGRSEDEFARSMGYADWSAYVEKTEAPEGGYKFNA